MIENLAFNDDHAEWAIAMDALEGTITALWSIKCRGCPLSRRYGSAKDSAVRAAARHARLHTHNVEVRNQGVMTELVRHRAQDLPLAPPF